MKNIFTDKINQHKDDNFVAQIFDLKNKTDEKIILQLIKDGLITEAIDEYAEAQRELFLVKHPKFLFKGRQSPADISVNDGVWIYYSWRRTLVHCLQKNDFVFLKTSRNFNLILPEEQKKISKINIGVAGLNVGNPGAVCLGLEGVGKLFKLADFDTLSISNLNRFRAGLCELGVNKAVLTARQIAEINPFIKVDVFAQGILPEKLDDFLLKPRLDILIEEMDNLPLKIKIRERARVLGIPVLMVTGSGENVIIDVERFDQNKNIALLNGLLPKNVEAEIRKGNFSNQEKIKLAKDFIGEKYLHSRLIKSFSLVGVKLAGIPQLAEASFLRGAVLCHMTRMIFSGESVPSGRYHLKLTDIVR